MTSVVDPSSIPHRVRCMVTHLGRVVRCPDCKLTTFEGFKFDARRDPLPGARNLVDPASADDLRELLDALIDLSVLVERTCLSCGIED